MAPTHTKLQIFVLYSSSQIFLKDFLGLFKIFPELLSVALNGCFQHKVFIGNEKLRLFHCFGVPVKVSRSTCLANSLVQRNAIISKAATVRCSLKIAA